MIEKFKEIFSGLDRAHGVYKKGDTQNGVKQKGKAFIKKEPVTDELWQKHLDGEESLGIIPVRDAIKDLDGAEACIRLGKQPAKSWNTP